VCVCVHTCTRKRESYPGGKTVIVPLVQTFNLLIYLRKWNINNNLWGWNVSRNITF
jgi:hypothetical protein